MKGFAHVRVAELAAEVMADDLRPAIGLLWEGIETGVTLTDEFRWFWDPDEQESVINRVLMHRCYVDSDSPNDQGCPVQIVRYAMGTPEFFELYAQGELDDYGEEGFLLTAGAYLGVMTHHIADLHTPVHVGSQLPIASVGYSTNAGFHSRVEADLDYTARTVESIKPYDPQPINLTADTFLSIADWVYNEFYLKLPDIYGPPAPLNVRTDFFAGCVRSAARVTADVWATVFWMLSAKAITALSA